MVARFGNKVGVNPFVQVTPGQLTEGSPEACHLFHHGGTLCGVYGGRGKDGSKKEDCCSTLDDYTPFELCRLMRNLYCLIMESNLLLKEPAHVNLVSVLKVLNVSADAVTAEEASLLGAGHD